MAGRGVIADGRVAERGSQRQRPDRARTGPGWRPTTQRVVLALPVVWILAVGWAHRWMAEDGFIYLRVVRQIRAGNGPVFNAGERVEAFTGVLWVAVLSIADLVAPIRLEWLAVVLGIAMTGGAVALALAGARRLWPGPPGRATFVVPFGAVVVVALFPVWAFASSGFETSLVLLWLGACLWILARWAGDPAGRLSIPEAVVLGLGWLVRPEMALLSTAFVLLVVGARWSTGGWRYALRCAGAAFALPVAYQVFRMGYYGSLVANTAIAKEGGSANWERGWRYLADFVGPYWLWVPAVGLVAGGYLPLCARLLRSAHRRRALVVAVFVLCGALLALYVVRVGGDYNHGRLFLPSLFAITAPVAVVPVGRRQLAGLVVGAWALVAVVSLRPDQHEEGNWFARGFLAPREFGSVTAADLGWGRDGAWLSWYTGPGYYAEARLRHVRMDMPLRDDVPPRFGAFWGIGVSGYAVGTDFHVLDQMGLADTFTAHLRHEAPLPGQPPRMPGHEKPLPAPWAAARVTPEGSTPDPAHFPAMGDNLLVPATSGARFQEQVAWARAALRCEPVARLLDSATEPLTPRRFLGNLVDSLSNTRLRIPTDPEAAYRRFCGAGTPDEVRAVVGRDAAG